MLTSRGSTTINFVFPERTAVFIIWAMTGWFSMVLVPVRSMTSASARSSSEFVIAPLPNAAARPATVGLCHKRAQWSMLFVPTTARASLLTR
jgi:hypothetical protein